MARVTVQDAVESGNRFDTVLGSRASSLKSGTGRRKGSLVPGRNDKTTVIALREIRRRSRLTTRSPRRPRAPGTARAGKPLQAVTAIAEVVVNHKAGRPCICLKPESADSKTAGRPD
ncbi:DNA-directed RNA polymerase subunit omega [Salmonella enterica subsp. enterica]|nr:DNA-directed RNA polymerase subunit omega [Salmonella enterica subsp. enterica]